MRSLGHNGPVRALIVANGSKEASLPAEVAGGGRPDIVIAADGGIGLLRAAGMTPDLVVGDLDSASAEDIQWARDCGATVLTHPPDKDVSDLELALDLVVDRRCDEVLIWAALGGRVDHSLINVAVACSPRMADVEVWLGDDKTSMTPVHAGRSRRLPVPEGATVSLLAIGGPARVTASGFRWNLVDATLEPTSSRGLSNLAIQGDPTVSVASGIVLALCNL